VPTPPHSPVKAAAATSPVGASPKAQAGSPKAAAAPAAAAAPVSPKKSLPAATTTGATAIAAVAKSPSKQAGGSPKGGWGVPLETPPDAQTLASIESAHAKKPATPKVSMQAYAITGIVCNV
jgi:hypothetical protein